MSPPKFGTPAQAAGAFVVSLDFELMWGVRDKLTKDQYGGNVLGVRAAIPRMLEAFAASDVRATWATVGLLFCESKDEMLDVMPDRRPSYTRAAFSNYMYLDEVGRNEAADPHYFGLSLLRQVANCPGQEVGTHTFSHMYCLEDGVIDDDLRADLIAAKTIAARRGIALKSIVFPRNQYDAGKIAICRELGIHTYRGNEAGAIYRPSSGAEQHAGRRALRLADAYVSLTGPHTARRPDRAPSSGTGLGPVNVPASRYLRPFWPRLSPLEPLRLSRMLAQMRHAAATGGIFHLWWHPHDFGRDLDANIAVLDKILSVFRQLRDSTGMQSMAMGDFHAGHAN